MQAGAGLGWAPRAWSGCRTFLEDLSPCHLLQGGRSRAPAHQEAWFSPKTCAQGPSFLQPLPQVLLA